MGVGESPPNKEEFTFPLVTGYQDVWSEGDGERTDEQEDKQLSIVQ